MTRLPAAEQMHSRNEGSSIANLAGLSGPPLPEEVELSTVWAGIRRHLGRIVLLVVGLGLLTFLISKRQPLVFQATSTLITTNNLNLATLRDAVVTATPVPDGTLNDALQGSVVMGNIIQMVQSSSGFLPNRRIELATRLQQEVREQMMRSITLDSRVDGSGNGLYLLTTRGNSPREAVIINQIATKAILDWDRRRIVDDIKGARQRVSMQLNEIRRQLARPGLAVLDQQTLLASEGSLQRTLAQIGIQSQGASGFLVQVAPAATPFMPVSPHPLRTSVLVSLITLVLGVGAAAVRAVSDRTVWKEADLLPLGLPVLAVIPLARGQQGAHGGRSPDELALAEDIRGALGFLMVNLLTRRDATGVKRFLITSTLDGEGKSSVTSLLAAALNSKGQKVLIVDAGVTAHTMGFKWKVPLKARWHQLLGQGGAQNLQGALNDPLNVQVLELAPDVHLLPAAEQYSAHQLGYGGSVTNLAEVLATWADGYDIMLVDGPSLFTSADSLVLGQSVDQTVIVVQEGRLNIQDVNQGLRRALDARVHVLGFVLNKASVGSHRIQRSFLFGRPTRATR